MPRTAKTEEEKESGATAQTSTTIQQEEAVKANSESKTEDASAAEPQKVEVPAGATMITVTGEAGAAKVAVVASAPAVLEAALTDKKVKVKVLRNHTLYLAGEGNVDLKAGQVTSVGMDIAQVLSLRQIAVLIG